MLILLYYVIIYLDYTTDIIGHDVKFNNSGHGTIIQGQFHVNVRTTLYKQ